MPKGWSKGLRSATDARVARAGAAHRGRTYVRRTAIEDGRWHRQAPLVRLDWTDALAYAVGLIATDGCLVTGRKRIQFGSEDRELVQLLLTCLARPAHIREERTRIGSRYYRTQFGDARFYDWLLSIGLAPRKSLTLKGLAVPEQFTPALVRGLLDGDGSIGNHRYRADTGGRAGYVWEYFWVSFATSSESHATWLRSRIEGSFGLHGSISRAEVLGKAPAFQLRYGKRASETLLSALYVGPHAPALARKRLIWLEYRRRHPTADVMAG